jgi:hypothetical protein
MGLSGFSGPCTSLRFGSSAGSRSAARTTKPHPSGVLVGVTISVFSVMNQDFTTQAKCLDTDDMRLNSTLNPSHPFPDKTGRHCDKAEGASSSQQGSEVRGDFIPP